MKLSIIIISYNTKQLLQECLESIGESLKKGKILNHRSTTEGTRQRVQNDPPHKNMQAGRQVQSLSRIHFGNDDILLPQDVEVIVVDNNSTDGTRKMLREARAEARYSFRFKTILNDENVGFAKANNQGVKESGGEAILFLNSDTVVNENCLSSCYRFLQNHPRVGALTCRINLTDGQFQKECHRGFPTPWNAFCHFTGLDRLFPNSRLFAGYFLGHLPLDTTHEIASGTGAFLMIPRKIGKELNWWDEDFFWYGEDLDLCYRVNENGYRVMYYPEATITHYHGASSGIIEGTESQASQATKKTASIASVKAMRVFYNKHYQDRYPVLIGGLVKLGINLLEKLRLYKINRQYR